MFTFGVEKTPCVNIETAFHLMLSEKTALRPSILKSARWNKQMFCPLQEEVYHISEKLSLFCSVLAFISEQSDQMGHPGLFDSLLGVRPAGRSCLFIGIEGGHWRPLQSHRRRTRGAFQIRKINLNQKQLKEKVVV